MLRAMQRVHHRLLNPAGFSLRKKVDRHKLFQQSPLAFE